MTEAQAVRLREALILIEDSALPEVDPVIEAVTILVRSELLKHDQFLD